jgi:hypothetical protein
MLRIAVIAAVLLAVSLVAAQSTPIGGSDSTVNNVTCGTGTFNAFVTSDCQPYLACEAALCRCGGTNATAVSTATARCTATLASSAATCTKAVSCVATFLACLEDAAITASSAAACGTWATRWSSQLMSDAAANPRNFSASNFAAECRWSVCRLLGKLTGAACLTEAGGQQYSGLCVDLTPAVTTTAPPVLPAGPGTTSAVPVPAPTSGVAASSVAVVVAAVVAVVASL